ncbi:MAG: hypothetical protein ACYTGZ_00005, partial [Planctomycetota bacterium]
MILRAAQKWREDNDLDGCAAEYDIVIAEEAGIEPEEEDWKAVEKWIEQQAPFYEQVDRAVRMPRCNFGV